MIRIDPKHLDQVRRATHAEALLPLVQAAVELEFSTIPPYLTAMLSLAVDSNRAIWAVIHSVVIEEMLHMSIMCNLLNALGGTPAIDTPSFTPPYPRTLPLGIDGGLVVGLEAFSLAVVQNTFMAIEEPDHPILLAAAPAVGDTGTIGDFYRALQAKLAELGDRAIFPRRQFTAPDWYPRARLFPITSATDARRAIDEIIHQGEGTTHSPLAGGSEVAHYYRFEQIVRGHYLAADGKGGYGFTGAAIPFDAAGVHPITPNQQLSDIAPDTQGYLRASQFAYSFSKLLRALQQTFTGRPEMFSSVLSLMFELKLNGQKLCALPTGNTAGLTYGPCFTRVSEEAFR